jgi:hypothetical protein
MPRIHITTQSNLLWAASMSKQQLFEHHRDQLDWAFRARGLSGVFWGLQDAFKIVVPSDVGRSQSSAPLIGLANAALAAAQLAGMSTVQAMITDLTETWAATAAAGAAAGLRLTKSASAAVQLVAVVGGGLIGAAAGTRLKAEVPIFRLQADSFGNLTWVAVPLGSAMPVQFAVR